MHLPTQQQAHPLLPSLCYAVTYVLKNNMLKHWEEKKQPQMYEPEIDSE